MQTEYIKLRTEIAQMGAPKDVLFAITDLHTMKCVHRFYTNQPRVLSLMEVRVQEREEDLEQAA